VLTSSTANDKTNTDRHTMEKVKPEGMLRFENSSRRDFMHHRNSSLNHILAKIMHDKKIAYVVDCSMIFSNVQQLLGRVEQNIMLAKKYKVNIVLGSFAKKPLDMCSWKDLISFFSFLNLSPKECKQAFNNVKNLHKHNTFKKTDKYIVDGVRKV
jgi:RNase P/RNase MRP subunit p30